MINFEILAASIPYYNQCGYVRVETPWTVTEEVSNITKPKGSHEFKLVHDNGKVLVASGEQGFLYQYLKGFLPLGKFQTTTPCYRFENFDTLHSKYFIKNELIDTINVDTDHLIRMVDCAKQFFQEFIPSEYLVVRKVGNLSYDIQFHDDELGSYGIRDCDHLKWIYGTGVAEPRLSMIMKKYGIPFKTN